MLDDLRDRFMRAQLEGDRRAASQIVLDEGLAKGSAVADLHEHVLREAQREIGRLWQENRVTIAQEHMATAIAGLVLTQLFERAPAQRRNGKTILVACVEGELHEFPARIVADALDLAGFSVRYLGADVPLPGLLAMIAGVVPDMIALSATMSFHTPALRSAVLAVRERFGGKPLIAAGGGALAWAPSLTKELRLDVVTSSAAGFVSEASRLLEVA